MGGEFAWVTNTAQRDRNTGAASRHLIYLVMSTLSNVLRYHKPDRNILSALLMRALTLQTISIYFMFFFVCVYVLVLVIKENHTFEKYVVDIWSALQYQACNHIVPERQPDWFVYDTLMVSSL